MHVVRSRGRAGKFTMHGSRFEIQDPDSTGSRILNLGGVSASACALCGCESARLKVGGIIKKRRFTPTEAPSKLEAGVENPIIAIRYLSIIRALLRGP